MTGKEKCAMLKMLREKIAKDNGIEGFEYKECPRKGPCRGTCPACDAESMALARELQRIRKYIPAEPSPPCEFDDQNDLMGMIESPAITMGEMAAPCDWVDQSILDMIKAVPEDLLSGKIIPTQNIRRGKISKDFCEKERIKDDVNYAHPRGLHKPDNKNN